MPLAAEPHVPKLRKANKADVAEFFGMAMTSVDAWIRRGCPYVQRGERGTPWVFDLLAVAEWRFGAAKKDTTETNPEDLPPKERKDWYEGEKVRVALEIDKGNLITLDQYREEMARILKQVSNALEMLPDVLERQCALQASVVVALQRELDKERTVLVEKLEKVDDGGAA